MAGRADEPAPDPRSTVEEIYRLFAAGDSKGIEALMGDQVVFSEPPGHPVSGTWTGKQDVLAATHRVNASLGLVGSEIRAITSTDDRVIVDVALTLRDKKGSEYLAELLEQWRVADGKIVEIRPYYWNASEIAERNAAGGSQE